MQHLILTTLVVRDYDEAIAFYVGTLGFELRSDTVLSPHKRWVVVAPPGGQGGLLLARAATPEQTDRIGDQTGGRVFLFLATDDLERDYHAYAACGVTFTELPRHEDYGTVGVRGPVRQSLGSHPARPIGRIAATGILHLLTSKVL